MSWFRAAVAALALSASSFAHATDGLEWKWDVGTERKYLVQAQVRLSEMIYFTAPLNQDLRVVEFYVALFTTCRSEAAAGKKAFELRCKIDDVQLTAAPPEVDSNRDLVQTLDEYDKMLLDAEIQMVFGADGRIRNFDLEGIDASIRRQREMQETLRLVLLRAYAGLELELPKKGDDGSTQWRQTESFAMQLPKSVGTMGGVRLDHAVAGTEGTVVTIDTAGKGTISSGETIGAPGQERPRNFYDMDMRSRATFDTAQGTLVSRDYLVSGMPTASSAIATGVEGTPYVQAVHVELIPPNAKVKPLDPNAETKPGESGI